MKIFSSNNISVELTQIREKGTSWEVSAHKKVLGFKKRISSDWFMGEDQAKRFAEQLVKDLKSGSTTSNLTTRKPGWTLHRSAR